MIYIGDITREAYKFSNCYVDNNEPEKERKRVNKGMREQSYIEVKRVTDETNLRI
jgi:hypothetical protein